MIYHRETEVPPLGGVFTFALYSMVESIYLLCLVVCRLKGLQELLDSREYRLFDQTLAERKRRIGYPYRSCRTSVPLFSGSGATWLQWTLRMSMSPMMTMSHML